MLFNAATSHTLSFLIYELETNPAVKEKLQKEIDALPLEQESLSYDQVKALRYVPLVWKETLRKRPVTATGTHRMTKEDIMLPSSSLHIPKGTEILIPPYLLHHDPDLFPEPDQFRPERWDPESLEFQQRHPFAFQGFSSGQRNCVGTCRELRRNFEKMATHDH